MQRFHFEDSRPRDVAAPSAPRADRIEAAAARHHTSPPKDPMHFADFCARMIERYAPARTAENAVA